MLENSINIFLKGVKNQNKNRKKKKPIIEVTFREREAERKGFTFQFIVWSHIPAFYLSEDQNQQAKINLCSEK